MRSKFLLVLFTIALACTALAQTTRQLAILDLPGRPGFDGIAIVKGMVLMSHSGAGTVDIFDPIKRRLIAHVRGMSEPRGIAVDEESGRIYVANSGAKNIVVLSSDDWSVKGTIPLSGAPKDLLYVPAWQSVIATDPINQKIMVVDGRSAREERSAQLPGTPSGMAFGKTSGLLFISLQDASEIVGIGRELQVTKKFPLQASQPTGIVFDSKQNQLYVAVRYAVLALDAGSGRELARVPAPGGIDRLWLDDDSRTLFGAAGGSLLIMRTDSQLHAVDEVPTDAKGYTVAYDSEKKMIFFPGGREGRSKLLLLRPPGQSNPTDVNAEAQLH